jgi:hypothetical protein
VDNGDGTVTLPEGGTIAYDDGTELELPAGTVVASDGTITLPVDGTEATLTTSDGKVYKIPGGITIIPDDESPLGFAFRYDNPFKDVAVDDWFYGDVAYTYLNGLFKGTALDAFSPNAPLTRGQLVTILGRMDGAELPVGGSPYADVPSTEYYAPYIAWAKDNGIVLGVGENRFEPDREVLRQEMVAIFDRYLTYAGKVLPATLQYVTFADDGDIDEYAKPSVDVMFRAGIIQGVGDNRFAPKANSTRAEAAAIMHRLATKLGLDYLEPQI